MKVKDFPFDDFLMIKAERDKKLEDFILRGKGKIAVVQRPPSFYTRAICRYKELQLESELEFLYQSAICKSDFMFSFLEPWVGVGVYAAAFGCPFLRSEVDAPQTHPIAFSTEDLKNLKTPDIKRCEPMQEVLKRIRFFKDKTGSLLDISLTDTQSPNDTASLIMDTCEFFMAALSEPEELVPFLQSVTDLIEKFTLIQMEEIGDNLVLPGHSMLSSRKFKGIALSDDNMAVVSPSVYEVIGIPFNNQLSRRFGGLSLHSCGDFHQNYKLVQKHEGLILLDCAIGKSQDPNPNDVERLKATFKDKNVILKVRLGKEDDLQILEMLIDSGLRLIVQFSAENVQEGNLLYESIHTLIDSNR